MPNPSFIDNTYFYYLRVFYEDTDAGGVVYHANYLKFYERARSEMMNTLGVRQQDLLAENFAFIVKSFSVDNIQAARFNSELVVKTRIKTLKKASIIFEQWIECDEQLINRAEVLVATINLAEMKPLRIPDYIYEELLRVC
ncbi:acyl-CoA thioesterase [Saccharobesus litoralis]|uniref:Acyl-CoA thioesterase n=1 Tax=Saccharobesus litoralis TaxID=2172099 RepID=A0A2S0VWK7_9ALTE|nr:YbgC/FadM family acyl-CoA thioesterase [Saccharobesus litoralis]AWB68563.1 acyl-CoA thioesterase [Saccharobesus litoralis]